MAYLMKTWRNALGWLTNPGKISQNNVKGKHWLGLRGSAYLFTLRLQGVDDPLGADAIWDATYGGQAGIKAQVNGKEQTACLHDALRDHPFLMYKPDPNIPARETDDPRTFSEVVIWIPAKHWKNEEKQSGYQFQKMVSRLRYNHQRDFKNLLYPERGVRYCIMPDPSLKPDEVVCQFGLSVFIPSADDEPHSNLSLRKGGKGYPLPDWIFFEQGKRITRPFGLYPDQQYLQLGYEREHSCLTPPTWLEQQQGFLQLRVLDATGDDRQQYADDEYITNDGQPQYGHGGRLVCHYHAVGTPEDCLTLEVIPHSSIADRIREAGGSASAVLRGLTIGRGSRRTANGDSYCLLLAGLVLPKLDIAGTITSWQLHFDHRGKLLETQEAAQGYGLRFSAQIHAANIEWQRSDMPRAERLQTPVELDCQGTPFSLQPAPVAVEQYALLKLPSVLPLPLDDQPCTLGRPDGKDPSNKERHIPLDLLDKAGTLLDAHGKDFGRSLNYLGFSARHIGLTVRDGVLQVRQLSSSPTYVLDQNSKLRDTLDADQEVNLQVGEQLLVGSYWLYFDRQH